MPWSAPKETKKKCQLCHNNPGRHTRKIADTTYRICASCIHDLDLPNHAATWRL